MSKDILCQPRGKAGFSLVELLVVIAIVSVLVSLLLPTLSKAREQAKKILCANQERQVSLASTAYAQDNKFWFQGTDYYMPVVPRTRFLPYLGFANTNPITTYYFTKLLACPNTQLIAVKTSTYAYIPGQSYPGGDIFQSSYWYPGGWGNYSALGVAGFFYGFLSPWTGGSAVYTGSNSAACPNIEYCGSSRRSPYPGSSVAGSQLWINTPSTQPMMVDAYAVPGGFWAIATTGDYYSNHADGVNVTFVDGHGEFRASRIIGVRYRQMWW